MAAGARSGSARRRPPHPRPRGDPGCAEQLRRQLQPAAATDHERAAVLDDASVADPHRAVGALGGRGSCETTITVVPWARASRRSARGPPRRAVVELAGRLVGEQQRRAVRERRAQRDALALAAGQLARQRRRRGRPGRPRSAARRRARVARRRDSAQREWQRHCLATGRSGASAVSGRWSRKPIARWRSRRAPGRRAGRCRVRAPARLRPRVPGARRSRSAASSCRRRSGPSTHSSSPRSTSRSSPCSAAASPSAVRCTQNTSRSSTVVHAAVLRRDQRAGRDAAPRGQRAAPPAATTAAASPHGATVTSGGSGRRPRPRPGPPRPPAASAGRRSPSPSRRRRPGDQQPQPQLARSARGPTPCAIRSRSTPVAQRRAARPAARAPPARRTARSRATSVPSTPRAIGAERSCARSRARNAASSALSGGLRSAAQRPRVRGRDPQLVGSALARQLRIERAGERRLVGDDEAGGVGPIVGKRLSTPTMRACTGRPSTVSAIRPARPAAAAVCGSTSTGTGRASLGCGGGDPRLAGRRRTGRDAAVARGVGSRRRPRATRVAAPCRSARPECAQRTAAGRA